MARFATWLANLSDTDIAYLGGTLLAILVVLIAGLILLVRSCSGGSRSGYSSGLRSSGYEVGPARADEYEMLQVIVVAHDQEAGLEVQTDAWSSYEELRELVVDAVPNMFLDTDEVRCRASPLTMKRPLRLICVIIPCALCQLTLEYKNEHSRWVRVKMKTPVDAVKSARAARITVPSSKSSSRALRR